MTATTKHTVGRWVQHDEEYCPDEIFGDIDGPLEDGRLRGEHVCTVNMEHPRGYANAALIIAAPDLLAACKKLIDAEYSDHFDARMSDSEMEGIEAIKAAIAKAEGRAS